MGWLADDDDGDGDDGCVFFLLDLLRFTKPES